MATPKRQPHRHLARSRTSPRRRRARRCTAPTTASVRAHLVYAAFLLTALSGLALMFTPAARDVFDLFVKVLMMLIGYYIGVGRQAADP